MSFFLDLFSRPSLTVKWEDEDGGRRRLVWLGDIEDETNGLDAICDDDWYKISSGGGELELGLDGDGESSSGGEFIEVSIRL